MCFDNICTDKLLKTYLSKSITFGKNLKTETWYFTARVWCLWLLLQFLLTLSNIFIYKTLGVVKWSLWKDKQPLKFWLFKDYYLRICSTLVQGLYRPFLWKCYFQIIFISYKWPVLFFIGNPAQSK